MLLKIKENNQIAQNVWEITLAGQFPYESVQPGQFIMVRIGSGSEHVLRRPISIAAVTEERLTIVLRVVGEGTKWLSKQSVGEQLDVLGPLGRGFPLPPSNAKVLVVGGGIGSPPLYLLSSKLQALTPDLDLVLGFRTKSECFWTDRFSQLGNLVITTDDGSAGRAGNVLDAVEGMLQSGHKWDYVYACGPQPMLRALQQYFSETAVQGYVSLEERMACGVGACYGCVCRTKDDAFSKRICADGPVFDWNEVIL